MKKNLLVLFLIQIFITASLLAQVPKNSWSLSFGVTYPKFINHGYPNVGALNYGGFFGVQRNFSEHVGLRMQLGYASLVGQYNTPTIISRTNSFSANFDFIYYFVPCEAASPYLFVGAAPIFYLLSDNRPNLGLANSYFSSQINGGLGVDWTLDTEWKLKTEIGYHTIMDNNFDGVAGPSLGGLFGGPYRSYLSVNVGVNYYFEVGEPSKLCQLYSGISTDMKDPVDYDKIEAMIVKHIPKEVTKEVVVEKMVKPTSEKWVLVGVNFDFNKSSINAEAYPLLYDVAKTLLKNPDSRVEIQGFTDNIGSESYNKSLSQKRADIVKKYLISKGVAASRLTAVGFGESNPVADNKTADGRAMNRRIEFKIQ